MIVYLARDIRPFVMYCVNGKPRSSLLIESTVCMIYINVADNSTVKGGSLQLANYNNILNINVHAHVSTYIYVYTDHVIFPRLDRDGYC